MHIWKQIHHDDQPLEMAQCFNNMGCIYETKQSYHEAMDCHQQALAIRGKYQIDMGSSYNNIANIFLLGNAFDAALENYFFSLKEKTKSQSNENLSLSTTLLNIALVYELDANYQQSLKYYKQVATIFRQIYSTTHPSNIDIQQHIQRISSLLKNSNSETLV
jgi:tetratricopeptide (TPR) repeat protein